MSKSPAQQRKDELALIHIAKAELGLDDGTYRDLLDAWTGEVSAGDMSEGQRHTAIENFKKMGFVPESDREERLEVAEGDKPHVQKIKGLWLLLHDEGAVQNPSLDSLNSFVQRMADVDHVAWVPPAEAPTVIEALKGWYERETTE